MAYNVSLGLVKYSFTDSLKLPLMWKHDVRPGLALVFSSLYMKITLGEKVLVLPSNTSITSQAWCSNML